MLTLSQCALLAALVPASECLSLAKRDAPRVLRAPIHRKRTTGHPVDRDALRHPNLIAKRAATVNVTLANGITLYTADVELGTPAQKINVDIDTGSSDLWVNTASSTFCRNNERICTAAGVYSANDSSSYQYVNSDFRITYADSSGASGDYATDTFSLAGVTIDNMEFGIGYRSSSQQNIFGVGYTTNEALASVDGTTYPNFPARLKSQGLINTEAYSLYLDDLEDSSGSILFGGVDTDKYQGTLTSLAIESINGVFAEFRINLQGLGLDGNQGSIGQDVGVPVILDSGSSLTYLPESLVNPLFQQVGATYDQSQGVGTVDCSLASQTGSVDFTFSSDSTTTTISANYSELVIFQTQSGFGGDLCAFGIAPIGQSTAYILGDTFLRSAYVVYDLEGNTISLAPTNFNSTSSNVREITSDGVPNASGVANAAATSSSAAGGLRVAQLDGLQGLLGSATAVGLFFGLGGLLIL